LVKARAATGAELATDVFARKRLMGVGVAMVQKRMTEDAGEVRR
jgi:hypothetical protein